MPRRLASPPSPLPFAAPGGAPACRVLRLGEATLPGNAGSWSARAGPGREGGPGRSGLAPCSTGPLHLPWGPPEGRGPGLCDTLSGPLSSQTPDACRLWEVSSALRGRIKMGPFTQQTETGQLRSFRGATRTPFLPSLAASSQSSSSNVWSQLL